MHIHLRETRPNNDDEIWLIVRSVILKGSAFCIGMFKEGCDGGDKTVFLHRLLLKLLM